MPQSKASQKAEETRLRILHAALELFREEGFESTTMREIAKQAAAATGAAYYYYPSKEAIVLDFYRRSFEEMQPKLAAEIEQGGGLEAQLRALISVKLGHFGPNRGVLRALLRNGADPSHPVSPFSSETREIREQDIEWFNRMLTGCGMTIPRDLRPALPGVLWFFQMGVILFWVIDDSAEQQRTSHLLALASKSVATLIRLSSLPLMRPLRRSALQLIEIVAGGAA